MPPPPSSAASARAAAPAPAAAGSSARLLTPNLGIKFEYRRIQLSGFDTTLTGGTSVSTSQVEENVFSAGVNVHFNSGPLFY